MNKETKLAVVQWVRRFHCIPEEIEEAILPPNQGTGSVNAMFTLRIAMGIADKVACEVIPWNTEQRILAKERMEGCHPEENPDLSDRWFLKICRTLALYDVLVNQATIDSNTRLWPPGQSTRDVANILVERAGEAVPLSDAIFVDMAKWVSLFGKHIPQTYPPEQHAAQVSLLLRASDARDRDESD